MVCFYGPGGNGKGTFLSTLEYVFGEYATIAASETFMETRNVSVLINGPPQILPLTVDRDEYFVQEPRISESTCRRFKRLA